MISPSSELHKLIWDTLVNSASVMAIADRIYHNRIPKPDGATRLPDSKFPYVTFESHDIEPDDTSCTKIADHFVQLNAWSRDIGISQIHDLSHEMTKALEADGLSLTIHALSDIEVGRGRIFFDDESLTHQAVIRIRATVEES